MNRVKYLVAMIFLLTHVADANVLHWLSKIETDSRPISNSSSILPKISANGRYVTYRSLASNLVQNDDNQSVDLFWHDLLTGETKLVSVNQSGQQLDDIRNVFSAPVASGRYVAFVSNSDNLPDADGSTSMLYVKDMVSGQVVNHSGYNSGDFFETFGHIEFADDAQKITFSTENNISPLHTSLRDQVYQKDLSTNTYKLLTSSIDATTAADRDAFLIDVSDNGRYILIGSAAKNLTTTVINNNGTNLYLRDLDSAVTSLVNVTPVGQSSFDDDFLSIAAVSNLGTVVFSTNQSDLVTNDTNGLRDVFFFDGADISRINLDSNNNQETVGRSFSGDISGDGSRIILISSSPDLIGQTVGNQLLTYEIQSGTLDLLTQNDLGEAANGASSSPELSLTGDVMAFVTQASDLNSQVVGGNREVFIHNNTNNEFTKITVPLFNPDTIISDVFNPRVSSDQLSVVYSSSSGNLVEGIVSPEHASVTYLLDRTTNQHQIIGVSASDPDISASGRYVVFRSNVNQPFGNINLGATQVFLYDRNNDIYIQIDEGRDARVNNEGQVVFISTKQISNADMNTEFDAYLFDPSDSSIVLVSVGLDGLACGVRDTVGISSGADSWVVFASSADNVVANDTNADDDVFMRAISNGEIFRVSETAAGVEGDSDSEYPAISENGQFVTFYSRAENLTTDDFSGAGNGQVFYYDRLNDSVHLASKNIANLPIRGSIPFDPPSISDSGRFISYVYQDRDNNDFTVDTDSEDDIVMYDRLSNSSQIISTNRFGMQVDDPISVFGTQQVVEDLSVSPPLIGVVFTVEDPNDLTEVPHHPGHDEAFLFQSGGPSINLNIQVVGLGQVAGTAGINCSDNCDFIRTLGEDLTLVANPGANYMFDRWHEEFGGCDNGDNPCDLIVDRSKTLTAYFIDSNEIIFVDGFE